MAKIAWQLGKVSWFDPSAGKGVIEGQDGLNYFVHYSSIDSDQKWKSLKKGANVRFQSFPDPKINQAHKVKVA